MADLFLDGPLAQIMNELNPRACLRDISTFWGFRSTVPGPSLRAASQFLVRRHTENGVQAELLEYQADDLRATIDGRSNPLAWSPRAATLAVVSPQEWAGPICSFSAEPLCLISNSTSTPTEGITAEVVVLHSGTRPEEYTGLDLNGKILFTDVWPMLADEQARLHGAVGLITDSVTPPWLKDYPPVRRPADVPDLTMWGTLDGRKNEHPLWGFSLTPRQGEKLRHILSETNGPVRLHAFVDADLSAGTSEVVNAIIPAADPGAEEIWVLSHSSEPGALDDASGCCLSLEIARALKSLIARGLLPAPKRTIRFLNAVEVEGYFPYVYSRLPFLPHVIAALALDSVGSDFRQSGGSLRLFRSPHTQAAFTDALMERIIAVVAALPNERFTPDPYDPFFWRSDPYFPGNDNFLALGYFNIPTPMLCNWPDKHYHSNLDTVDKLSPNSLGRGGLIAALYIYLLASAGTNEASWIAGLTLSDYKKRILEFPSYQTALQGCDALRSILRLSPSLEGNLSRMAANLLEFTRLEIAAAEDWGGQPVPPEAIPNDFPAWEGQDQILRPFRWQMQADKLSPAGRERLSELRNLHPGIERIWDYLNGQRSAREIQERVQLPTEAVKGFLDLIQAEGLAG